MINILCFCIPVSCTTHENLNGVWVSDNGDKILGIDDENWKIVYSGVASFCDEFTLIGESKLLNTSSYRSKILPKDTFTFTNYKSCSITLQDIVFYKENSNRWDSLKYFHLRRNDTITTKTIKNALSIDLDMYAAILTNSSFETLDTTLTADDDYIKYNVWFNGKVVASKISANNFLCLDLY